MVTSIRGRDSVFYVVWRHGPNYAITDLNTESIRCSFDCAIKYSMFISRMATVYRAIYHCSEGCYNWFRLFACFGREFRGIRRPSKECGDDRVFRLRPPDYHIAGTGESPAGKIDVHN